MTPIIRAQHVTKIFHQGKDNEVVALEDVSLTIDKGDFVGIIGPSGSGKSTLMHLLGALDVPTKGDIWIDTHNVTQEKESQLHKLRANRVGFVFQGFNLITTHTALENVMLAIEYGSKKTEGGARHSATRILEEVGLSHRIHHYPNELSGGEQQRVALARALVNKPALVLADEPTGQLDTKTSQEIMSLMKNLSRRNKETFVIVTHNQEVADSCFRIINLRDGKVLSDDRKIPLIV